MVTAMGTIHAALETKEWDMLLRYMQKTTPSPCKSSKDTGQTVSQRESRQLDAAKGQEITKGKDLLHQSYQMPAV
jgi:hypothetical protein